MHSMGACWVVGRSGSSWADFTMIKEMNKQFYALCQPNRISLYATEIIFRLYERPSALTSQV